MDWTGGEGIASGLSRAGSKGKEAAVGGEGSEVEAEALLVMRGELVFGKRMVKFSRVSTTVTSDPRESDLVVWGA